MAGQPLTLLVCGASQMGKSHLTRKVLVDEFGAGYVNIDDLYSIAVARAGLCAASDDQLDPSLVRARRLARDRKWPSEAKRRDFFAAYTEQVAAALARAPLVAFDGGSLRHADEVDIVLKAGGPGRPALRLCVEAPYPRWLQNRVIQAAERKRETLLVRDITPAGFQRARKKSRPAPHPRLQDYRVADAGELRALVRDRLGLQR